MVIVKGIIFICHSREKKNLCIYIYIYNYLLNKIIIIYESNEKLIFLSTHNNLI